MKRNFCGMCAMMVFALLVITGCNKDSESDSSILGLLEKKLVFSNFQAASLVLGQPNLTTGTATVAAQNTFSNGACSQPAVISGKLYLPDYTWNRVMVFNSFPTANNQNADAVLGQANFTSTSVNSGGSADRYTTLSGPEMVASEGKHFLIQDYDNSRILLYDDIPSAYNEAASVVVGQPDFTTTMFGTTAAKVSSPEYAIITGSKLIVADSDNNRVLIYNSIPTANGASADIVLGQNDFIHGAANDIDHDGATDTPTASTLNYPICVWSDGTRLIVSDNCNNRILIWNSFPTANFQPADIVVGQSSMTANGSAMGSTGLNNPYFLTVYAGQLITVDCGNCRVLIFNSLPTVNGASADIVLGQGDFNHRTKNDDNQNNAEDLAPTARTLARPIGVCATKGKLIVSDMDNSRMLVYESQ